MKKTELEYHAVEYHRLMEMAVVAENDGYFRKAIDDAISAWPFIDGMMQYERRYNEKDFYSIAAIDLVLKYAPLILNLKPLSELEELLTERKRIEKNTEDDLTEKIAKARRQVYENHRLWNFMEWHPGVLQSELSKNLGGQQDYWRSVIAGWHKMGLVRQVSSGNSYMLWLSTRMGEIIKGICPKCGKISEAPKAMFLSKTSCMDCGKEVLFVITPNSES